MRLRPAVRGGVETRGSPAASFFARVRVDFYFVDSRLMFSFFSVLLPIQDQIRTVLAIRVRVRRTESLLLFSFSIHDRFLFLFLCFF